jgi:hypothetical protein
MREDISEKKAGGRYAAGFFLQLPARSPVPQNRLQRLG